MSDDAESVSLRIAPGYPGDGTLLLKFPGVLEDEITSLLDEHGVEHGGVIMHDAGPLIVQAITILTDPRRVQALAEALQVFARRHDNKKFRLTPEGFESEGYSASALRKILKAVSDQQAAGERDRLPDD